MIASIHPDHLMLASDELLAALFEVTPCPDCRGQVGVIVYTGGDLAGEIHGVAIHNQPCPQTARSSPR
jgi:hypothetical protein